LLISRSIRLHHCIMLTVCFLMAVRRWVRGSPFDFWLQMALLSPRHGGCRLRRRPRWRVVSDSSCAASSLAISSEATASPCLRRPRALSGSWVLAPAHTEAQSLSFLNAHKDHLTPPALLPSMPLWRCLYCYRAQP
jgi:hypothetical protein